MLRGCEWLDFPDMMTMMTSHKGCMLDALHSQGAAATAARPRSITQAVWLLFAPLSTTVSSTVWRFVTAGG